MPVDLTFLILAICLSVVIQVGIGFGFSIVAGPSVMIVLGTATALPAFAAAQHDNVGGGH